MYEQPSSKRYLAQRESHDEEFSLLRSEDFWPLQKMQPTWALNPQRPFMMQKNTNEYVGTQNQYGKWNQRTWNKYENKYIEDKTALFAAPLTSGISHMSSLLPGKKSDCSTWSQGNSVRRDWTNFESCSFRGMEREIEDRVSYNESKIGDVDKSDIPFHYHPGSYARNSRVQIHSPFELIKFQCLGNPILMKKVAEWSLNYSESNQMTRKEIAELSRGRYWVTARSAPPHGNRQTLSFKEDLDDLRGGYQEVFNGVFQQQGGGREAAIRHRLFKYNFDRWAIDKWEAGVWRSVARETQDRSWVDLRYNKTIHVKVIPFLRILQRLRDKFHPHQKIGKCVEFLFTSFDRKKFRGKLKARSLKHNIANLKLKLEKQYFLNFAINAATTADCITIDDQKYHNSGEEFEG